MIEKKTLKIGILIGNFNCLENWELRIIERIILDKTLHLSLLIKDGRSKKENFNVTKKLKDLLKNKNIFNRILFKFQVLIEKSLFKVKSTVKKETIIKELNSIKTIYLNPKRKGFLDVFSKNDSEKVKSYDLDIILRHEFNIIRGDILKSSKFGIWSFHHADNSVNRGGPPAFWEILNNESVIGVTLQQLTPELDGGFIIDKAFYNRDWSYVRLQNRIFEASVTILFKNIKLLQNGHYNIEGSPVYYNPLYRKPKLIQLLQYIFNFYFSILEEYWKKVNFMTFGSRYNCWTLFIGNGSFLNSTLFRLRPVKMPKNEFWADPFIFNYNSKNYIFFENYNYKLKKGKISCGIIEGDQLIEVSDVLDLDYHLSYPFIFEEDNSIFLIPETSENNRLEIYRCIDFPNNWELYSTAFDGEKIIDAHIYRDQDMQKWLFLNKQETENTSYNSDLHIYKFNNLKFDDLQPHTKNPVIIDSKTARNGGAIFKSHNQLFRPSQGNIDGIYGKALNINKIEKLTINEYVEKTVMVAHPNFKEGLVAMHHLHQKNGLFVIDAAYAKK